MHLNIIVRAADAAQAAAAMAAIGIPLEAPNRPNPNCWHAWGGATLVIENCSEGEAPSVGLGFTNLPARMAIAGKEAVIHATDDDSLRVMQAGGLAMPLRWRDEPVHRPGGDQQLLPLAVDLIEAARGPLAAALLSTGVRNPRIVGPELLTGRFERMFVLIVDGADDAAIGTLDAALAPHANDTMRIEVRAAGSFDADTLARIDRLAWDVTL